MKYLLSAIACLCILSWGSPSAAEDTDTLPTGYSGAEEVAGRITVYPEVTTFVTMSQSDINHVICTDGNYDWAPISSDEKGISKMRANGSDLTIKFKLQKSAKGETEYSRSTTDIHISCAGQRYILIAKPEAVVVRPIYLSAGVKKRIEESAGLFKGIDTDDKIIQLMKAAATNPRPHIPSAPFRVISVMRPVKIFQSLSTVLVRRITVDGIPFELLEYEVRYTGEGEITPDWDDLAAKLGQMDSNLGLSMDRETLSASGGAARVYLVRSAVGSARNGGK